MFRWYLCFERGLIFAFTRPITEIIIQREIKIETGRSEEAWATTSREILVSRCQSLGSSGTSASPIDSTRSGERATINDGFYTLLFIHAAADAVAGARVCFPRATFLPR